MLLDGRRVLSCLTLAVAAEGAGITAVEGLAGAGELTPVQQAFVRLDGFQCGYCTSGQLCSAGAGRCCWPARAVRGSGRSAECVAAGSEAPGRVRCRAPRPSGRGAVATRRARRPAGPTGTARGSTARRAPRATGTPRRDDPTPPTPWRAGRAAAPPKVVAAQRPVRSSSSTYPGARASTRTEPGNTLRSRETWVCTALRTAAGTHSPQHQLHHPVDRHNLPRLQQRHREHAPALPPTKRNRPIPVPSPYRPQGGELHAPTWRGPHEPRNR